MKSLWRRIRYWWIELTAIDASKCGLSFRVTINREK